MASNERGEWRSVRLRGLLGRAEARCMAPEEEAHIRRDSAGVARAGNRLTITQGECTAAGAGNVVSIRQGGRALWLKLTSAPGARAR